MAREIYGYAESSEIKATNAGHIYNIKNDDKAIENGTMWVLGDLDTTSEVYPVTPAKDTDKVVLALSVLMAYDTTSTLGQHEMFLRKEAGEMARGYELVEHDRFAVADYMITPASSSTGLKVGNYIIVDGTDKQYKEVAKAGIAGKGFAARISEIRYKSNLTLVYVDVIQNEAVSA